jgi:hypothetical protein
VTKSSRYAATALAPATETGAAVLCTDCGALVADTAAHDKWHGQQARKPARPAKIT